MLVTRPLDPALDLLALHRLAPSRYPVLLESSAHGTAQGRWDLLLATDGLLKYAPPERICDSVRRDLPAAETCNELIRSVRLPTGSLQDDVGVVLLRICSASSHLSQLF